jgi:hypothetical protein
MSAIFILVLILGLLGAATFLTGFATGMRQAIREYRNPLIGVSLLGVGQGALSRRFASKGPERYAVDDLALELSPAGAPLIPGACARPSGDR